MHFLVDFVPQSPFVEWMQEKAEATQHTQRLVPEHLGDETIAKVVGLTA